MEEMDYYKKLGVKHFNKNGRPNLVYKFNRDLFLERGKKADGSLDMRFKENKQKLYDCFNEY